jgi:uncharacterized repeat protein (TIGR03803 family)
MTKLKAWAWICLFCAATIASQAETFKTLASFIGTNGAGPNSSVVQGLDGHFYGATTQGGDSTCNPPYGCGTVFKISTAGILTALHSFELTDGAVPYAELVQATDGAFYGTTYYGGVNCAPNGCGTVFKITPGGTLTTLHSFDGTDGSYPAAGLVQATNGDFYGTTRGGGINGPCGGYDCGTVFRITPSGTMTTLHSFCTQTNCTDGETPMARLVQAIDGNFYGTTSGGGANGPCGGVGCGTVFRITPRGTLTTLHSFCTETNCTDGEYPLSGLVQATGGNFYGSTSAGGVNGYGVVFKITPAGKLTTLHIFTGTDGNLPSELVQATNGKFYGTTSFGGANCTNGCGTVFQITAAGKLTTLYSFCHQTDCPDGQNPYSGLIQATSGDFLGTTFGGGAYGAGAVFSVAVGLGPFVENRPTSGKVGAKVAILGNNLKGTTGVSFNGKAATFTIATSTEIKTAVPVGATTGFVTVTTPTRKLRSSTVFRVTH